MWLALSNLRDLPNHMLLYARLIDFADDLYRKGKTDHLFPVVGRNLDEEFFS